MSVTKNARCLLALASLAVAPLHAQPAPGAITTVGINPNVSNPNAPAGSTEHRTTTTTATRRVRTTARGKAAIHADATRLAALLRDTQTTINLPAAAWNTIAGESTALANRLYARTSGGAHQIAMNVRKHVRLMAAAARRGDASGARTHAGEALPFVYQLIDWSAPPR